MRILFCFSNFTLFHGTAGAVQEACSLVTGSCICRPGVGGDKCDRCLPGYFALDRITRGANGCTRKFLF